MSIKELFQIAVKAETKAQRRNAFRQLRELAARGSGDEAQEAREALQDSAAYMKRMEAA